MIKLLFCNCKFPCSFTLKKTGYVNIELKFTASKSYQEKRRGPTHWGITTSLLLKALKQHLIDFTSFRLSKSLYSRYVLFKRTNDFGFVFPTRWDRITYRTKFPTHVSFLFSIFCFSYHFSFDTQNLCFAHVTILPVSC